MPFLVKKMACSIIKKYNFPLEECIFFCILVLVPPPPQWKEAPYTGGQHARHDKGALDPVIKLKDFKTIYFNLYISSNFNPI